VWVHGGKFIVLPDNPSWKYERVETDIKIPIAHEEYVILHGDNTWSFKDRERIPIENNNIPLFLRQGIKVKAKFILQAIELYRQGWRYKMPMPKSPTAHWSNFDYQTEWWFGYWYNIYSGRISYLKPRLNKKTGLYNGDGVNRKDDFRTGGCPRYPTEFEWLLSDGFGIKPYGNR
jgi:hypothetical protein